MELDVIERNASNLSVLISCFFCFPWWNSSMFLHVTTVFHVTSMWYSIIELQLTNSDMMNIQCSQFEIIAGSAAVNIRWACVLLNIYTYLLLMYLRVKSGGRRLIHMHMVGFNRYCPSFAKWSYQYPRFCFASYPWQYLMLTFLHLSHSGYVSLWLQFAPGWWLMLLSTFLYICWPCGQTLL